MSSVLRFIQLRGFVLACVLAGPAGAMTYFTILARADWPNDAPEAADASMAAERAAAERIGFRGSGGVRRRTVSAGDRRDEVRLSRGECGAVIVATDGRAGLFGLYVEDASGKRVGWQDSHGNDAHVQWCSADGGVFVVRRRYVRNLSFSASYPGEGLERMLVLRAPSAQIGGASALRRGERPLAEWHALGVARIRAAADRQLPAGARVLLPAVRVYPFAALLVPEDDTSYAVLEALGDDAITGSRITRPYVVRLDESAPPEWRPRLGLPLGPEGGVPTGAIDLRRGGVERVLLVLDTTRLGRGCVRVQFTRLLEGHEAHVSAHRANDAHFYPVDGHGTSVMDRVCPNQVQKTYTVPVEDQEEYDVRVIEG